MMSPLELELRAQWRHQALQEEAEAVRLADSATRRTPGVRTRLAGVLYALAVRLDPCAVEPTPAAV